MVYNINQRLRITWVSRMLGKMFQWLDLTAGGSGGRGVGKGAEASEPFPNHINHSGRISLTLLLKIMEELGAESFVSYVERPFLVGWGICEGTLSSSRADPHAAMQGKTLFFKPAELFAFARAAVVESEPLKQAIYPLTKSAGAGTREPNAFTIGRMTGNDLVIPDFAVSKKHARIEIAGNRYYIADLGSSNGTAVNGYPVAKLKIELGNKDVVRFARYEFTFLFPETLYQMLKER
jgi:hypothetical protein